MIRTKVLCWVNNYIFGKNKFCTATNLPPIWEHHRRRKKKYRNNQIHIPLCECKKTIFEVKGNNNCIDIGTTSRIHHCHIAVVGDNNKVSIGNSCGIYGLNIVIAGNGCEISIGDNCNFFCHEDFKGYIGNGGQGTVVRIGSECLFAPGIYIRADDAHHIYDIADESEPINLSRDIVIENHVWFGAKTMCLKGSVVREGCIIGAGTILTGKEYHSKTVWAGNPACAIREKVNWEM